MGTSIAIASLIVAIANVASHARMRGGRSRSAFSLLLAYAMWGAVYAPVVVHLVLPVEDPYTGDGSPMAALLGAMIFFAIASVFFLPVAIALVVRAHHCTRLRW
jgi:hypothetical protein